MRFLRFGLPVAVLAAAAAGAYVTYPGNDDLAVALRLTSEAASGFDPQLDSALTALIASAEIGPDGEIFLNGPLADPRFLQPASGRYWQIGAEGRHPFSSRSLWDRKLEASGRKAWTEPLHYRTDQFSGEPLDVVERTVRLPGSDIAWQFLVAGSRD